MQQLSFGPGFAVFVTAVRDVRGILVGLSISPKDCDGLWFVSSNKPQPSQGLSKIESSSILRVEKALLQSSYWYSFWKSLSEILKF